MFPWNLCVHLCAFALMTPGVKSVEITSLKTNNVSMHFVCPFERKSEKFSNPWKAGIEPGTSQMPAQCTYH